MSKSVKTSNDWMSLFLGDRDSQRASGAAATGDYGRRYGRAGGSNAEHYSERIGDYRRRGLSPAEESHADRYSSSLSRYSPPADYSISRSDAALNSPYRRSHTYAASSSSTASYRYRKYRKINKFEHNEVRDIAYTTTDYSPLAEAVVI